MKTTIRVTYLILLSLLGATNANDATQWGPATEGCRISLSFDKTEYDFGESINLSATVQNVGREKLQVEGNQLRFPYRFEFYGPKSEETPLTLWGQAFMRTHGGSQSQQILSRGETRTDTFPTLNRAYDMTLAGKYSIVVHRIVPSELDPKAWIDVASNTLIIEVKDPYQK
jgi:hypothetical protein